MTQSPDSSGAHWDGLELPDKTQNTSPKRNNR